MNDSIGMNYCAPDANVWAVNLDADSSEPVKGRS